MKTFKKLLISTAATALVLGLASCNSDPNAGKTFTMHDFIASTKSLQWNPLTWETSDDSAMLSYLSMGFFDYRVDVDAEGKSLGKYVVVPEMAEALPTDVTASYVGKFGVKEGEANKAFRLKLNKAAKWQDGTAIKADDYIYSMKQQLDPEQMNRRADSYYGGDFSLVNAQNYLYSGKKVFVQSQTFYSEYSTDLDDKLVFQWGEESSVQSKVFAYIYGYKDYLEDYGPTWVDLINNGFGGKLTCTEETVESMNGKTLAEIKADADMADAWTQLLGWWQTDPNEELHFFINEKEYPKLDFNEVGLQKVDDYTIDIIIEKELENPDFYVPYHLSSTWLVNEKLYEASWTTAADGSKVNLYGKTVANTISYGPYKLDTYEEDKQLKFSKNDQWYGYSDEAHVVNGKRLYQTTNIQIDVIEKHESALLAFKKGQIDGVGLVAADLEEFGNSKYKMLTPQSYTTKLSFNTDADALAGRETEGVNKIMLTNQKFRHALALSFDRAKFCSEFTAGHTAGFGMLNYMYQFFNSTGTTSSYRDSDAAKDALCRVYGVEYGPGTDFATLDEAYKSITGLDVAKARELLKEAIVEAKADGTWNGSDTVDLEFTVYQNDDTYVNMFNFMDTAFKELAKGTELEGKIKLSFNVDDDYYNTMYAGKTDIIFTTWGGATYGTFGVMSNCYVDDYTGGGNQMEIGFNTALVSVKFTLNETIGEKTYSLKAWADWLNSKANETGEAIDSELPSAGKIAPETRAKLLAELEYQYLNSFVTTPIYYRQTVSLRSMKVNYASSDYIDLVGFGGISQLTYNYDDAAWNAYVESQGGELKY